MDSLYLTFVKRPYVFLFLFAFLFLSIRNQGVLRTVIWLSVGYFIAFLSEYSSINNGFPYGEYHYIYENLEGELILAGVPVWDSLSYSFLTYAGYFTIYYALPYAKKWKLIFGGAFLTTLLDVITDPVAKLGEKWFLGEIYYYGSDGFYFNIPLSNFAGWFLTSLIIIGLALAIFKYLRLRLKKESGDILNVLFYLSICLFNCVIALMTDEYLLTAVNISITIIITFFIFYIRTYRLNHFRKMRRSQP